MSTDERAGECRQHPGQRNAEGVRQRPLVHRFRTAAHHYVFDANTNRVLRTDAITWDIIEFLGILPREAIVRRLCRRYPEGEIAEAHDGVVDAQAQGRLLPPNSPLFAPGTSNEHQARDILEHECSLLILNVTERCNFRCTYCAYGPSYPNWRNHSAREMAWETAKAAMDEYFARSDHGEGRRRKDIAFYGGEPLLHFTLIQRCVEYARAALGDHVHFHLTTNGALLQGTTAEFLASEHFAVTVSLDGPCDIHDACRRFADGSGTWESVIRNVGEFVRRYPQYGRGGSTGDFLAFHVVLSPLANALRAEEFFREVVPRRLKCDPPLTVNAATSIGSSYVESLAPEDRRIPGLATLRKRYLAALAGGTVLRDPDGGSRRFLRGLFNLQFRTLALRPIASAEHPVLPRRALWPSQCIPGATRWFVNVDGTYYPCERVPEVKDFEIGNVRTGLDFAKAYDLKKGVFQLCAEECEQCWCVNLCRVGCCANIQDDAQVTAEAKRRECAAYRDRMHRVLVDYFETIEANPHAFDFLTKADTSKDNGPVGEEDPS